MYIPAYYRQENQEELAEFIRSYPFGMIISACDNVPVVTHIPFELMMEEGIPVLLGHISAANPQKSQLSEGAVLAVFTGPHTYISAALYDHPNVSTWNYTAVHVQGTVSEQQPDELRWHLLRMMQQYDHGKPTADLQHLPQGMFEKMQSGVYGFRIRIDKMEGAWKLSQNRNDADFLTVTQSLLNSTAHEDVAVGNLMKALRPHLFNPEK